MELMVAIAITGMMTAAGYGAFASLIDHRRALREATAQIERAAALREQIDGWLALGRVELPQGGGPTGGTTGGAAGARSAAGGATRTAGVGTGRTMPNGTASAAAQTNAVAVDPDADLTLTTTASTPATAPSTRLRLYVDGDPNTPERGLCIEYQTSPTVPIVRRELDSTVTAMTVEFLDGTTHRWLRASQGATPPALAVRVTLSSADPARVDSLPAILRLPIVRASGDPAAQPALGAGFPR